ncbi:tetraacyldisaccharide 4'-kinase [Microvirga pudoricolor]|uniref:tetraacyldisaccharide 4'-kinase n=1 Tax=Microvirga pudoricolor TaxID=2778729 RepID=UPI001950EBFC|nr:tetraacyldisaccharide 4'-kinase [Microvirga pudoricolor]MBM6592706.1 tetraacyldisaccharide 4'-kinase [Microvirga pudoricolor]
MRAPAFWWQSSPGPVSRALYPLGLLYGGIAARRLGQVGERADLPVICVGNFTAGGAGKTPTAQAVAELLKAAGETPAFLSRGYGGRLAGPARVEDRHTAEDVGDEPLLLARTATAIVSRDRPAGAALANRLGATVIVMDDGLQNPSLVKDLALAVVDGRTGIGNGLAIPAGPLRAPMEAQWPAVDAVLVIGDGLAGMRMADEARGSGKPVFRAALKPDEAAAAGLRGRRVFAFAGIGRPEKFFDTLKACGAILEKTQGFPDHQPYSGQDLDRLRETAARDGLQLVTTEKDMARIGAAAGDILALPIHLQVEDQAGWRDLILSGLAGRRD